MVVFVWEGLGWVQGSRMVVFVWEVVSAGIVDRGKGDAGRGAHLS